MSSYICKLSIYAAGMLQVCMKSYICMLSIYILACAGL